MTAAIKATTLRSMPQLIKTVQALHAKAIKYTDKADQIWITIGIELKEAKDRNRESGGLTWPEFAKKHFNFGQSRADELIRIADGRTTVEEVRAGTAERVQKHAKAKPALANAGSSQVEHDDDEPEEDTPASRRREARDAKERKKTTDRMVDGWIASGQLSDQQIADYRERGIMPPWQMMSACGMVLWEHKPDVAETSCNTEAAQRSKEVNEFGMELREFGWDFYHRFAMWRLANPDLSDDDKRALIGALQSHADEMSRVAQSLRTSSNLQNIAQHRTGSHDLREPPRLRPGRDASALAALVASVEAR
jgi:hypothetical protein